MSRIFFTAERCGEPQRVYVREGTTTRELSVSQCNRTDPDPLTLMEVTLLGPAETHWLATHDDPRDAVVS